MAPAFTIGLVRPSGLRSTAASESNASPVALAPSFSQRVKGARAQWRRIAEQLRPKLPKLASFLDDAEADVLAYMTFPSQHRAKLHSTTIATPPKSSETGLPNLTAFWDTS
jgi:hypothetical protein